MSENATRPSPADALGKIIVGMRAAFACGENVMEYARDVTGSELNESLITLIAYDLQAGSYIAAVEKDPAGKNRWFDQMAGLLRPWLAGRRSMLDAGCGEATTLAGVLSRLEEPPSQVLGFDLSLSRCLAGAGWLKSQRQTASLFVADLLAIPLADSSVDVVVTSHALEPNGGREEAAIAELLRVARHTVVLVEPIYELASPEARERMERHRYVRRLKEVATSLGATIRDHRLLEFSPNPLNPSGVLVLEKSDGAEKEDPIRFQCPLTGTFLLGGDQFYRSTEAGVIYPVIEGIPLLRAEHAVVASALCR